MNPPAQDAALREAYDVCRKIARYRARNFYFAFIALPARKRDAICAVYAFMRQADDLADDRGRSLAERRAATEKWLAAWHAAQAGLPTDDPVFLALRDTAQKFTIEPRLLDELVEGTTMDLREGEGASQLAPYTTFDDLYRYCYLVASVVGLVSIRIFGYENPEAEPLAERTGIAFQLTNILRDVREDAALGRVYIPRDDIARFNLTPEEIARYTRDMPVPLFFRGLMQLEADRARAYYQAAEELIPLIAPDSQGALWVLVQIYRRLLERIDDANYNVFARHVSVPTHEKIAILIRGIWRTIKARRPRPSRDSV